MSRRGGAGGRADGGRDLRRRTFEFARRIVRACQELDRMPGVPRTMASQLLRAGTSVGANVAILTSIVRKVRKSQR